MAQRLKRLSSQQEIGSSNPPMNYLCSEKLLSKKEKLTEMINYWKNSHPSARNNHRDYAEVIQFSYQNTRVLNNRSVFSTIQRSTTSAPNSRANNRQREQRKVVKRSIILTEVNGEQPSNLSSCGLAVEASISLA